MIILIAIRGTVNQCGFPRGNCMSRGNRVIRIGSGDAPRACWHFLPSVVLAQRNADRHKGNPRASSSPMGNLTFAIFASHRGNIIRDMLCGIFSAGCDPDLTSVNRGTDETFEMDFLFHETILGRSSSPSTNILQERLSSVPTFLAASIQPMNEFTAHMKF
jgi:hypothetical protein